jgi:hypothetical protein
VGGFIWLRIETNGRLVNTVEKIRVPYITGNFSRKITSIELVILLNVVRK